MLTWLVVNRQEVPVAIRSVRADARQQARELGGLCIPLPESDRDFTGLVRCAYTTEVDGVAVQCERWEHVSDAGANNQFRHTGRATLTSSPTVWFTE